MLGESVTPVSQERIPVTIEARFSYFWPESSLFRQVYHNGGVDYQLTGTVPLFQGDSMALRGLNFWWAVDYFKAEGKSTPLENKTTIQIEPLTAGLKWIYPKSMIRPFFGAGMKYYFVQIYNDSPYVKKHVARNGVGFSVETGVQLLASKYIMSDLFIAYSFKQFGSRSINSPTVQATWFDVGGLNIGGGIGVTF